MNQVTNLASSGSVEEHGFYVFVHLPQLHLYNICNHEHFYVNIIFFQYTHNYLRYIISIFSFYFSTINKALFCSDGNVFNMKVPCQLTYLYMMGYCSCTKQGKVLSFHIFICIPDLTWFLRSIIYFFKLY